MATSDTQDNSLVSLTQNEQNLLDLAFKYAYEALAAQEVPVGCIFVRDNATVEEEEEEKVIALGRNEVNETRNATRHAEMICIDRVQRYCADRHLDARAMFATISVYVTVEPCIMCAAALYDLHVRAVIFGCRNDRFGGQSVFDVARVLPTCTTLVKGGAYRADEAMRLLKEFYAGTNPSAPASKVKRKDKKDILAETNTTQTTT